MAEVYFYHLTSSPLEQALPDLLEKVRGNNWRALIRSTDQTRLTKLDTHLWQYRENAFMPHGLAGGDHDADQPILLTTGTENTNNSEILRRLKNQPAIKLRQHRFPISKSSC